MSRGRDDVARLLALVPYLRSHPGVPVATVAKDFGVPTSRVVADLRVLWMCGLPGGLPDDLIDIDMDAVDSEGTVTITNADALPRPTRLTADEAWALLAALQVVADLADEPTRKVVASATATLRQACPDLGPAPVEASAQTSADPRVEWFTRACQQGWRLSLTHRRHGHQEATTHLVDPVRVEEREGQRYLVGWSLTRQAWRTWRLDRILDAHQEGSAAHRPDPPQNMDWFTDLPADTEVTLTVAPSAGWVWEYHPARRVEQVDEGWRVTFAVATPVWLAELLVGLGPQVLAVDPPGAAAGARDLVEACSAAHGMVGAADTAGRDRP